MAMKVKYTETYCTTGPLPALPLDTEHTQANFTAGFAQTIPDSANSILLPDGTSLKIFDEQA